MSHVIMYINNNNNDDNNGQKTIKRSGTFVHRVLLQFLGISVLRFSFSKSQIPFLFFDNLILF